MSSWITDRGKKQPCLTHIKLVLEYLFLVCFQYGNNRGSSIETFKMTQRQKKINYLYEEEKLKCDLIGKGIGIKYLILGKGSF